MGYVHGSPLAADFSTGAAIFLLFLLSLGINLPLKAWKPAWALSKIELLVCYIMMIVSCAIPSWGFTMLLIPWLAAPTYYVTPENQWADYIIPHLPKSHFVLNEEVARAFFEGLREGEGIPWGPWIGPLLRWGCFALCFYVACVCVMILLRRQWITHERLSYPLAQMPLAIIPGEVGETRPAFRRPAFWIGVAIPAFVHSLRALNAYWPNVPFINLWSGIFLSDFLGLPGFNMWVAMPVFFEVVGLSFLLSSDMAFSLWLFAFLALVEQGIFQSIGFRIGPGQLYSQPGGQEISNQALGAMVVLVAIGLWRARSHLWRALLGALGLRDTPEEREEMVSYRVAYLGLGAAGGYVLWWWYETGLG